MENNRKKLTRFQKRLLEAPSWKVDIDLAIQVAREHGSDEKIIEMLEAYRKEQPGVIRSQQDPFAYHIG